MQFLKTTTLAAATICASLISGDLFAGPQSYYGPSNGYYGGTYLANPVGYSPSIAPGGCYGSSYSNGDCYRSGRCGTRAPYQAPIHLPAYRTNPVNRGWGTYNGGAYSQPAYSQPAYRVPRRGPHSSAPIAVPPRNNRTIGNRGVVAPVQYRTQPNVPALNSPSPFYP